LTRAIVFVGLCGCATLADAGGGDANLPNALAGPFRPFVAGEVGNGRVAPWVLRDTRTRPRDLHVLDEDGDPRTLGVEAFAAREPDDGATEPTGVTRELVRIRARDGRSFEREAEVVLAAAAGWEGGRLAMPCAVRNDASGETSLYYAAGGGIGLARGPAGGPLVRVGEGPVLEPPTSGWDAGVTPQSPSVVRVEDGSFRMFFEADGALGEATSDDGVVWQRLPRPALAPSPSTGGVRLAAPFAVRARSALGRDLLWLYHAVVRADGARAIEVAAREGDGPLVRAVSPVLAPIGVDGLDEPAVVRFEGVTLIYATASDEGAPAVLGGLAPATFALTPPEPP